MGGVRSGEVEIDDDPLVSLQVACMGQTRCKQQLGNPLVAHEAGLAEMRRPPELAAGL